MVAMLAVTTFIHYLDRNNLAIVLPEIARSFGRSDQQVGAYGEWILGAFYTSFGLVQIFLTPFAERWGLRRSLLASVVGFSGVTLLFYPLGRSVVGRGDSASSASFGCSGKHPHAHE
jgi:MFS family permease